MSPVKEARVRVAIDRHIFAMAPKPLSEPKTMPEAWQEHVLLMTNKDLASPESCRDFIQEFTSKAVQNGMSGTVLDGQADVQKLVISFLSGADMLNAGALKVLAQSKLTHGQSRTNNRWCCCCRYLSARGMASECESGRRHGVG